MNPTLPEFKRLARKGNLIPVSMEVVADRITPVSLLASYWDKSPYCFLLESVEGGEKLGRYSIVSFEPEAILEENRGRAEFRTPGGKVFMESPDTALEALQKYMRCVKPAIPSGFPRFFGGAVGYSSYETVHQLERLPLTKPDAVGWPLASYFIANDLFVFDNTQQVLKLITCVRLGKKPNLVKAYAEAQKKLHKNLERVRLSSNAHKKPSGNPKSNGLRDFKSSMSEREFISAVKKAKEHIAKGDIIQVVLSRRMERPTTASPMDIYRCLRVVNPSPYMYLIRMGGRAIIGSSPEALIRLEQGMASTRPIAGTRRRGQTPEEDRRLEKELLADPKERAEHLMLVDLGRNDLGRVCQSGTVKAPTFMVVERYSHVMHIVSEVMGKIRSDKDAFDLFKAVFPAGTVSGAPKIRAMEIIDGLEAAQRGPYAGAVGYFGYSGNMDMAITIRTILWDRSRISFQTGAGLVADSDPKREYQETENKALAMKETIRLAESRRLFWD